MSRARAFLLPRRAGAPAAARFPNPVPFHARGLVRTAAALVASCTIALAARADAPTASRAEFPDRRIDGVTATDLGLAGAGLATDGGSSLYANPALALAAPRTVRVAGALHWPSRDDLRASTTDFQEASGFVALSEAGLRTRWRGLGVSAYFAQPTYRHEETRFVGVDPQTGVVTDPFRRENRSTSAVRYGGLAVAGRLPQGLVVGVAGEIVLLDEHYSSTPLEPSGSPVDTFLATRSNKAVKGGALGLSYTAHGLVGFGASYHLAGKASNDSGYTDEGPRSFLAGVRVGRTAGSAAYVGARFTASRRVNLQEEGGSPTYVAPARREYSAGYAYDAPEGTWFFRLGGGISPRPSGGDVKLSRFGAAFGVASGQGRVGVGYAHTGETHLTGRPSSSNSVTLTVEVQP